jgi:hypothetical protein
MLSISKKIGENSVWSWSHIKGDFKGWPEKIQNSLDWFYSKHFKKLIYFQLSSIAFFLLVPRWPIALVLVFTSLLVGWRFKGVFNGGSDYMTMVQLMGLVIATSQPNDPFRIKVGLYYIAVQTTLSYFVAGVVKLRNKSWRNGLALEVFVSHSNYSVPINLQRMFRHPLISALSAWGVILWECLFPLVWIHPALTGPLLLTGFFFHLMNFATFGLNRFVFTWLASYPSIIFCTQNLKF